MKNIKMIFSSILFLLVCQFNFGHTCHCHHNELPVYKNYIQAISLSYDESMLVGVILLDNDLIFRIVDYKNRDDNVMNTWQPGDELALDAHIKDDSVIFSITRVNAPEYDAVEAYAVFDITESPMTGLIITEVNENGKYIKLNDDSVWHFSWYNRFSTHKWKEGERVIVSGNGEENHYRFINLDIPVIFNALKAKAHFTMN